MTHISAHSVFKGSVHVSLENQAKMSFTLES